MQLSNLMTHDVEVINSESTLTDAAKMMKRFDVGVLPVFDDGKLVGLITDRDITIRAIAEGHDPTTMMVRDVMTPQTIYAYEDQELREAADIMKDKQIRRLPVLNRKERLVGMISLADLAVETGDEELAGETLKHISKPAQPVR